MDGAERGSEARSGREAPAARGAGRVIRLVVASPCADFLLVSRGRVGLWISAASKQPVTAGCRSGDESPHVGGCSKTPTCGLSSPLRQALHREISKMDQKVDKKLPAEARGPASAGSRSE